MIPEETIQEVAAATDIVDLVGSYFPLRRAGSAYKAVCPFHTEKTPSFTVNPVRNTFHCFGCGKGGSAIRFVMDYENLSFPDAVKKLAGRAGITIAEDVYDPEEAARGKLRSRLLALHKDAASWYHRLLMRNPGGSPARDYLKKRNVSSDTAREWELGFAPESAQMLHDWASESGYKTGELTAGGLLSLKEETQPSRGTYARFRNRLMFPICNDYGEVIAFSGRVLDPEAKTAKYMNSPETPIFHKSKTFFGLDRAKRAILKARTALVCEGQLDLITCAGAGFANVVAPLGTAFTEQHSRLLARHADEVILCFDADNAGFKAAERAFAELAKANLDVRVATIPQGEDPDSLIKKDGPGAFQAVLDASRPFFDHQIERGIGTLGDGSIRDRVRLAESVAGNVALLTDKVAQDTAINNLATRLKISSDELRKLVGRKKKDHVRWSTTPPSRDGIQDSVAPPTQIHDRSLRGLYWLSIQSREALATLRVRRDDPVLTDTPGVGLLLKIIDSNITTEDSASFASFLTTLPSADEAFLSQLSGETLPFSGKKGAEILLLDLEREQLQRRIGSLTSSVSVGDTSHLDEITKIKKRLNEITGLAAPGRAIS